MLFHIFTSQEERRNHGGSAFIEMQFCKLPPDAKTKKRVAVSSIHHWQNDSLYIDDLNLFYQEYSHIFDCGIYNNLKSGIVDLYGINYYSPSSIDSIIHRILAETPKDYEIIVDWLTKGKAYQGFYILGI